MDADDDSQSERTDKEAHSFPSVRSEVADFLGVDDGPLAPAVQDVMVAYARTMMSAQLLEAAIGLLPMALTDADQPPPDGPRTLTRVFRSSLRQLTRALDDESLDRDWDGLDTDLDLAATRRNSLAHEFFIANVLALANEGRARGLLPGLEADEALFNRLAGETARFFERAAATRGVDWEELDGFVQAIFVLAHRNPEALPSSPFDPTIPEAVVEFLRAMGIEVDIPDDV